MKCAIVEINWAILVSIKLFWRCWGFLWASVHNFQLFGERGGGGGHWIRPQLHRTDWLDISNQSMRCKNIYYCDARIDKVFYNNQEKNNFTPNLKFCSPPLGCFWWKDQPATWVRVREGCWRDSYKAPSCSFLWWHLTANASPLHLTPSQ